MVWIDHVDIIQIRSCCLISKVYRMLKRNVPDREGLELGIACLNTMLVLLIKL